MKLNFSSLKDPQRYKGEMTKNPKAAKFGCIIAIGAIILAVIIIIVVIFVYDGKKTTTQTTTPQQTSKSTKQEVALKACQSSANSPLETIEGIKTSLFYAKLSESRGSGSQISPVPLSFKDYEDEERTHPKDWSVKPIPTTTLQNDIFFKIERSDSSALNGYAGYLQLCDKDNKSNMSFPPEKFKPSVNATYIQYYIYGGYEPATPGIYRIDAYLYTPDGKWQLVNRLENVEFTE
jgi:hypothetical protein